VLASVCSGGDIMCEVRECKSRRPLLVIEKFGGVKLEMLPAAGCCVQVLGSLYARKNVLPENSSELPEQQLREHWR
jgi:hypothetical protein